ncbi:MAG: MFS transporter [Cyanosarcina radialis HA8281-LM2]|jgi:MFS family permease|nr:MFS transporter [Cyanosarcina radialis HA8281-LM2]
MTSKSRDAISPFELTDFRLLWLGQSLLLWAMQFWLVAIAWLVLQQTGSGIAIGTVLMSAAIPRALFMLVGGALGDRFPPQRLAAGSAIVNTLIVAIVALALSADALQLIHLIVGAALFGLADAFLYPALLSILPRLVEPKLLGQANAFLQGGEQITNIVGPATAGFAIHAFGLASAFQFDAFLFAIGSFCIWWLRPDRVTVTKLASPGGSSLASAIGEALRYVWNRAAIRVCLLMVAMLNFATMGPAIVGLAKLVELRLGGDAATYGYLQAAYGLGALVSAIAACRSRSIANPIPLFVGLAWGLGVGMIALGFTWHGWVAGSLLAAMGLGGGFVTVIGVTWMQQQTPPEMQGRMMSLLLFAVVALDPFSQAISGLLMEINLVLLFVAAGLVMILTGAIVYFSSAVREPIEYK